MGFLTLYRKRKKRERELRIIILGLDNAGKSSILKHILGEDPMWTDPTYGFSIRSKVYENHLINFWDIGGQRSLRPFWRNYFEKTDGIIWVVDGSDAGRFGEHVQELNNILRDARLLKCSVLLLVNKQDLYPDRELDVIQETLSSLEDRTRLRVLPCSAYTGKGINEGLSWLLLNIQQKFRHRD
ncbi:Small GTPase superfamily ARF/SAR type [Perkinsela sp. CCAP 1560/4]|nr:Small GTPase superfamily ARF/SAR type [Perkinsela sp. CCAP 1560/4]|eukprot:KNH08748.1 Small GTPase superfamily ARF/SAR type [Perkinsela sp. CCAP 1560/4]